MSRAMKSNIVSTGKIYRPSMTRSRGLISYETWHSSPRQLINDDLHAAVAFAASTHLAVNVSLRQLSLVVSGEGWCYFYSMAQVEMLPDSDVPAEPGSYGITTPSGYRLL